MKPEKHPLRRGAIVLSLACLPVATDFAGQGPASGAAWDTVRLDLEVTPMPEEGAVGIEGVIRVRLEAETSQEIVLAINGNETLVEFLDVGVPAGARVELNARHPTREPVRLALIRLEEPLAKGAEVELPFTCEATKEWNQFQVDPGIAFASWVEAWYPFVPDLSTSLSEMMSAPGTTVFHLPPGWDVVSNGTLEGRATTEFGVDVTWNVPAPVARSFSAGPYRTVRHRVGEREVGVYLLPGTELDASRQAELLGAALAAQEARFGPYPYATYAIAEVPEGSGGFYAASEQGFIMAKSSAFDWDHGNLPLWGHEMAHGWWGNLVGSDGPGGILCSESLAQYSAVLAIEALEGEEAATEFLRFSRSGYNRVQCARGYFEMIRAGNDRPLSELSGDGWEHNLSDAKGHWVFHMLRRRVGDELFFRSLRRLIANHARKDMRLEDVRAEFLRTAPEETELERFFEQWLDREGAPVLKLEWKAIDTERVEVRVEQTQEGPPYHLKLDVGVDGASGSERTQVTLDQRAQVFVVPSRGRASGVRLDPDHALLIWHPDYGEAP